MFDGKTVHSTEEIPTFFLEAQPGLAPPSIEPFEKVCRSILVRRFSPADFIGVIVLIYFLPTIVELKTDTLKIVF